MREFAMRKNDYNDSPLEPRGHGPPKISRVRTSALLQYSDVGQVGQFRAAIEFCHFDLGRQRHAAKKALKTGTRAEVIEEQVRFQKQGNV
jgi:hypothetical protein